MGDVAEIEAERLRLRAVDKQPRSPHDSPMPTAEDRMLTLQEQIRTDLQGVAKHLEKLTDSVNATALKVAAIEAGAPHLATKADIASLGGELSAAIGKKAGMGSLLAMVGLIAAIFFGTAAAPSLIEIYRDVKAAWLAPATPPQ